MEDEDVVESKDKGKGESVRKGKKHGWKQGVGKKNVGIECKVT